MANMTFIRDAIIQEGYGQAVFKTVASKYLQVAEEQLLISGKRIDAGVSPEELREIQQRIEASESLEE